MKKLLLSLLVALCISGCASKPSTPTTSETPSAVPSESAPSTVDEQDDSSLSPASIGIFNDPEDPSLYCVVEVNVYNDPEKSTSINLDPLIAVIDKHMADGSIESHSYSEGYEDSEGKMLAAMGFTPQSLVGYNIDYFYHYFKVADEAKDDFLAAVKSSTAKYGTRIEEGDAVEINFYEGNEKINKKDNVAAEFEALSVDHSADGYDYYVVDADNNLFLKVKDDLNELFTIGLASDNLYGAYYQDEMGYQPLIGWYVSDNAYTHHWESGGFSVAEQQLSDNLRIADYSSFAVPTSSDPALQEAFDNFDYESVSLVVLD
ncbi:MAG: hypothetical protein MR210_04945 [Erysipelotrichaceae bacterium]|nr:hypothetical protein [Erysipelotrichaceae bacterium]MDY5252898.1 hypothetical protein [Erysipelotrichaceae bacterium]